MDEGYTKNGTMHWKFQVRYLSKIFEFKERRNNSFQKIDIEKITETKPVRWTWHFPSSPIQNQLW